MRELVKNLYSMIEEAKKFSKTYILNLVILGVLEAIPVLTALVLLRAIVYELATTRDVTALLIYVIILVLVNIVCNMLTSIVEYICSTQKIKVEKGFEKQIAIKSMEIDFITIEEAKTLDLKSKALEPIKVQNLIFEICSNFKQLIYNGVVVGSLSMTILILNPLIIVFITSLCLFNSLLLKKSFDYEFKVFDKLMPINRRYFYFFNLTMDYTYAKDIRMFGFQPLILAKIKNFGTYSIAAIKRINKNNAIIEACIQLNKYFVFIVIYFYLMYQSIYRNLNISDFVFYFGVLTTYSYAISEIIKDYTNIRQLARYLNNYFDYLSIGKKSDTGGIIPNWIESQDLVIEFKDVYFKYPNSKDYILKGISFKITAKEKVAFVGLNGSGKSTIIKLLLKLYTPTKGAIYLNNIDINTIEVDYYRGLFSTIFQDFKLFAAPMIENITLKSTNYDKNIVDILIKELNLPYTADNINDNLYKILDSKGIEPSGGQEQLLAIARALYEDNSVLIMDEPTSALDPIMEDIIFNRVNKLAYDKLVIFVSHRLSNCTFADKILVINEGKIVSTGNHKKLMQNCAFYNNLFTEQAKFYE